MVRQRKRGRPPGGEKGAILSVRISPDTRWRLDMAAKKNRRRLSREVEARLDFSFGRYGSGRRAHVADLAELVALLTQSVEQRTRRAWDRDPATREYLIRGFADLVNNYSSATITSPSSLSVPGSRADFERKDPAAIAVGEVMLLLLSFSVSPVDWEGGDVLSRIQRNFEKRRRKK
jgi:hypothetical protein